MASSSPQGLPQMSDFSPNDPFSTAGDMKFHLQSLLDSKEKQLQQAGSLGQRVLAQQMELEERIRQLQELEGDKAEDDEVDNEARERYQELADTILSWDQENSQLSNAFASSSKRFLNGGSHSPVAIFNELPREEPERLKPAAGSSAAQSRRAKNAAHRADDVEFAFEIGSGLLTEVRRLQSLLGERDKAIQDMKEEKDDLERTLEGLRTAFRQAEKDVEECKEANWELEVTLRELKEQHTEAQSNVLRLESDQKRNLKLLKEYTETTDQLKNDNEKKQTLIDELKAKHDTDVAQARKQNAVFGREKSELQQTIDTLKADLARAGRRIPRYGSPLTPGGPEQKDFLTPAHDNDPDSDVFGTTGRASTRRHIDAASLFPPEDVGEFGETPDPSPIRKPFIAANHPSNEIEALQQRLAHAQRQISTLKGTLNREKQARMRLEGSPGGALQDDDDEEGEEYVDENTAITESKRVPKRATPFKVGRGGRGRGRGRGGITLIQRLGMAAASPHSEYNDDDDLRNLDDSPPPVPRIPSQYGPVDDDEDEVSQFFGSGTSHDLEQEAEEAIVDPTTSNRTSVDGMDPAFANVLKRVPSNGSYTFSPLRQSILNRSGRGGARRTRGGAPARPSSIVDAPEALATELSGMDASPYKNANTSLLQEAEIIEESSDGEDDGEYIRVKKVEKAEFGCQTEPVEEEKTVVLVAAPEPAAVPEVAAAAPTPEPEAAIVVPAVEHAEIGIQSEPIPEPKPDVVVAPPPPKPVTSEMALQTEPEPVPEKVSVESGVGTDPIPEPEPIGKGLPPLVIGDGSRIDGARRTTLTQADIALARAADPSVGETTIMRTRSFLAERANQVDEEDDAGEATETGADTEDDYLDARQSIGMSTPSEDFHSIMTVSDNEYSDSEDGAESIKASHFSRREKSTNDDRPETPGSYYPPAPTVTYETIGVSADLYEPPEPVIVEKQIIVQVPVPAAAPPKPVVKEMSIQTEEWKPPVVLAPTPIQTKSPTLMRVGSQTHQFQFIPPPPPSANGIAPTPHSAPVFTAPSPVPTPLSSVFRETSGGTLGRRSATADRRQSIESLISSGTGTDDAATSRSRVPSSTTGSILLNAMDKTRPPIMTLPPPPKAPPPPNSMPPPNFIPERRVASSDGPPPRPSSPPPPELIQRATTPLGSILNIPGKYPPRLHGSSLPPSQTNIRQLPSTSSFRSAAAYGSVPPASTLLSSNVRERERREMSAVSLATDHTMASPRSSMSSENHLPYNRSNEPTTPNKTADVTPRAMNNIDNSSAAGQATDPVIIHAITQTMIGEFLYKYTRKAIGKGVGERRHKRFFWVHPYTKTLYWSSADPGSSNVSESSAKSAYIEGVRSILDPNPMPPGLYQYSVVISTPQREMKITAPTKERHDIWLNALKYLLARPNNPSILGGPTNKDLPQTPGSPTDDENRGNGLLTSPQSLRATRTISRGETWNSTPRGQRSRSQLSMGGSVGKRSGTPAVEYLRWNAPESPYSPDRSFVDVPPNDPDELDFELHDESMSDGGFEGLENVRACCDGRHTVGHHHKHHKQSTPHDHGHHYNTISSRRSTDNNHLEPALMHERPSSPAWSFRSRTGSTQSHEGGGGGGGMFSWGRGDDGKIRFGSRRSTKSSVPVHD